jgi:tRNA threonylcarbamoyladenosine biosynthesis protein TsaB
MAYLLYIDTSGPESLVMLLKDADIQSKRINTVAKDHGQLINIHLQEVLTEAQINWNQLDAVCVLNGPGSYTGLRIGLGSAKGICYAHQLPLVLLNKLELIYSAIPKGSTQQFIGILSKAREQEYFITSYAADGQVAILPSLSTTEDIKNQKTELNMALYTCEAVLLTEFETISVIQLHPEHIARVCFDAFLEKKFEDLFLSEPFYLKNVYINKINKL